MKKYLFIISIISIVLIGAFYVPDKAKASFSAFVRQDCYTSSATSTLVYQTPGTATSTVTCRLGENGADQAHVAVIVNASSTSSVWNFYVEESMNGQDWYPITQNQVASTSAVFNVNTRFYSSVTFASSTIGGSPNGSNSVGVNGTNNRNHYIFDIPVRMKRIRVVSYMPVGSTNGGLWLQILPKAEI